MAGRLSQFVPYENPAQEASPMDEFYAAAAITGSPQGIVGCIRVFIAEAAYREVYRHG